MDLNIKFDLEDYRKQGFARADKVFSPEECEGIRSNIGRFVEEAAPRLRPMRTTRTDEGNYTYVSALQVNSDYFTELLAHPRLVSLAERALGKPAAGFTVHFRSAQLDSPRGVEPHQDLIGPNFDPPEMVTLWLSLGEYDEDGGCLRYIPGSHKEGLLPHDRGRLAPGSYVEDREVAAVTGLGDVLVHHPCTLHRSALNVKPAPRWALMFTFAATSSRQIDPDLWMEKYYPHSGQPPA